MFCSSDSCDSAIVGLSEGPSRRLIMGTFYFLYGPLPLPTRAATVWCGSCSPRGSDCTPAESSRRSAEWYRTPTRASRRLPCRRSSSIEGSRPGAVPLGPDGNTHARKGIGQLDDARSCARRTRAWAGLSERADDERERVPRAHRQHREGGSDEEVGQPLTRWCLHGGPSPHRAEPPVDR